MEKLKRETFMDIVSAMKKNAVILQKPSGTIALRVDLNAVQRKFYNALLYVAKQNLKQNKDKKIFTVPFLVLKELLNKQEKSGKNNTYYIEKLNELKEKNAEYNILQKDKGIRTKGKVSLVSDLSIEERIQKDEILNVTFEIPEKIKNALIDPKGIYANINLIIIRGLSSKYAIILYELCKDYERVQVPEMTMKEFRKIFGIEEKYKQVLDIKKRVINPALKELNNNSNIDFLVSCEMRKTGKAYTHIKFTTKPKPARLKLNQQANKALEGEVKENPELQELLQIIPQNYRNNKSLTRLLLGSLEQKGKDYTKAQIEYTNRQKNIKNYVAYLKKAIENDYAGVEVIDLGDIVDDWKQKLINMKKIYTFGDNEEYLMKFIKDCDDDGICDVQFVSKENSEKIRWARVPEEKLKNIVEK